MEKKIAALKRDWIKNIKTGKNNARIWGLDKKYKKWKKIAPGSGDWIKNIKAGKKIAAGSGGWKKNIDHHFYRAEPAIFFPAPPKDWKKNNDGRHRQPKYWAARKP